MIDKVKIIVVGDSGSGKSSLVHLIANDEVLSSPGWTVGSQVEVKLHDYKEGTPTQKSYFIELWDIGGSSHHANARRVFYQSLNGIILVHDLTNIKSYENLQQWLLEVLNKDGKDTKAVVGEIDVEQFAGCNHIPTLVVGTKADQLTAKDLKAQNRKNIADWCGAEEINISCLNSRAITKGSSDAIKITRFFDKVIERKFYTKDTNMFVPRKIIQPIEVIPPGPVTVRLFTNNS